MRRQGDKAKIPALTPRQRDRKEEIDECERDARYVIYGALLFGFLWAVLR